VRPLEAVLPPRLALALQADSAYAYDQLTHHDLTAGRRLYAAALYDLLALNHDAIAIECGWSEHEDPKHSAKRAVSEGRGLWHQVGAWPWFYFEPTGRPPRHWRTRGGAPHVEAALWTWATGRLSRPGSRRVATNDPDAIAAFFQQNVG